MSLRNDDGIDPVTLDRFSAEGAPDVPGREEVAAEARTEKIRRILDARFSFTALEQAKRETAAWWDTPRNDMARGFYSEALREARRLAAADDALLDAEVAAIRLAAPASRTSKATGAR